MTTDSIVIFPNAKILYERLIEEFDDHFIEKTGVISKFADKRLYTVSIATVIKLMYIDYVESLKKALSETAFKKLVAIIYSTEPSMFEALLKDAPDALEELKQLELYTPE